MILKPNMTLPLASSYNERGVAGFTNTVTNALDQRKINSMYEVAQNAGTGGKTLYLVSRPGPAVESGSYGSSGQVGYLVSLKPGATSVAASNAWVFSTSGNDIRASDTSTTTVIATASGYAPAYVEKTVISGTETLLVQLRNASFAQTAWYSTAIGMFTQISDADFTGLTVKGKMEAVDGWTIALTSANQLRNSDINSIANWNPANYITKQITQDIPVGLMRLNRLILAFGVETVEGFVNAGRTVGSPLQRVTNVHTTCGLATVDLVGMTHYYAKLAGKLYFLGRLDGAKTVSLVGFDGQGFGKVSNPFIDKILAERSVYSVNAVGVAGQAAIALALDLTTATTQRWLMYFPAWNDWFEWQSTVYSPVNAQGLHLGVDQNQHKIYSFGTTDNFQDAGTSHTWTHQFKIPANGNNRRRMPMLSLVGDTARSAQAVNVQFSDDDGQNWSTARTIDMTSQDKAITRCGAFKSRMVRLSYTGSNQVRLEKFAARVE